MEHSERKRDTTELKCVVCSNECITNVRTSMYEGRGREWNRKPGLLHCLLISYFQFNDNVVLHEDGFRVFGRLDVLYFQLRIIILKPGDP